MPMLALAFLSMWLFTVIFLHHSLNVCVCVCVCVCCVCVYMCECVCVTFFSLISYKGFPTRMVYLYDDIESRYTILVGNPRYLFTDSVAVIFRPGVSYVLITHDHIHDIVFTDVSAWPDTERLVLCARDWHLPGSLWVGGAQSGCRPHPYPGGGAAATDDHEAAAERGAGHRPGVIRCHTGRY